MFDRKTETCVVRALRKLLQLRTNDCAAMAVEYGLLVALVILSIIASIELVSTGLNNIFDQLTTFFNNAN